MKTKHTEKLRSLFGDFRETPGHLFRKVLGWIKRKPMVSIPVIVLCLVVVLLSLGGKSDVDEVMAYHQVERGDFLVSIVEGGTLQAVNEVKVRNEVDGNSRIIYIVPEGTYIEKGELIVELDASEAESKLNLQQINYEKARATLITQENNVIITQSTIESDIRKAELRVQFAEMDLEKFQEIDREQRLRNAQMDVISAEESLKIAEERLEWSEKLTGEGFETKSNLDRDRLSVTNQKLGLEKAENLKKMLTNFDLAKLAAEYKSDLQEARENLERVKKQGESKLQQSIADRESASKTLDLSKDNLDRMTKQLEATKLYAPQDGLIVYAMSRSRFSNESMIEEGAQVRKRQELISIPDTSTMKVSIKVHESSVGQVKVGQTASIVLDSLPDERFRGEVTKIAVLPDAQSRFGNPNLKVYNTEIQITDDLPDVKPGVSARAEIFITQLKDVTKVPIQAVTTIGGEQVCFVKGLVSTEPQRVEIGLFNNKFIEIKQGLKKGDKILLNPPFDSSMDLGGGIVAEGETVEISDTPTIEPRTNPAPGNSRPGGKGGPGGNERRKNENPDQQMKPRD